MPVLANELRESFDSAWYLTAMEQLIGVVQELSHARSIEGITEIVRVAARSLTGADGATFVLRDGDQCYYVEENAVAPLWKGRRFPMSACISGWVMLNARQAVIEDIYTDTRVPADAYRPTFVKSLAMVPIRRSAPIGAIGNYWSARRLPTQEEVAILQALADTTSVALENAELYGQYQQQVDVLQEQRTRIEEQRDTLEVFTRALAHDLKEPVRSMKSFSRAVLEQEVGPEQEKHYLRFIRNAADRMDILVDSVLRYIQLDDPAATPVEWCAMQDILESVQENLSQLIGERCAVIENGALPPVQVSRPHLMQVLQNLIANAIHHNETGVTVRVQAEEQSNHWLISVRDNGGGIAPEHAQRIFQPFKRLTHQDACAGLGLATCEKIVVRYGGSIWCESQPGEGATFLFTLPRTDDEVEGVPAHENDGGNRSLACMLLVDDRPDDLELSRIMLSRQAGLQCRVLTAQDGKETLEILSREPVDVMLLDINMPGMDGFEVLQLMKNDAAMERVAVIMCTGSTYEKDKERSRSMGAVGYIVKPPSFEELRPLLEGLPTLRLNQVNDGYELQRIENAAN